MCLFASKFPRALKIARKTDPEWGIRGTMFKKWGIRETDADAAGFLNFQGTPEIPQKTKTPTDIISPKLRKRYD